MKQHLGQYYDKSSDFQAAQFQHLKNLMRDVIEDRENMRSLLDIGCGTGARTLSTLSVFPQLEQITGIDPDFDMISVAEKDYDDDRIEYVQIKAEELDEIVVGGYDFDIVFSNWALHWVSDKDAMMQAVNKMSHPGSYFALATCQALPSILQDVDDFIRADLLLSPKVESPFHYLTGEEWKDFLASYGWEMVEQRAFREGRIVPDCKEYLDHWFTASTTKFLYGKHLAEMSELTMRSLIWTLEQKYSADPTSKALKFYEDVVFTVVKRKG